MWSISAAKVAFTGSSPKRGLAMASPRVPAAPCPGEPTSPAAMELRSKASRETMFTAPAVAKSPWLGKYGPFVISTRSTTSGMMKFVSA